ncbi:MAG: JDVT-CTERM system glutamic-type intramembrane protease, partial [Gammaproteobacteria bacterium]
MKVQVALSKDFLFLLALLAGPLCWLVLYVLLAPDPQWDWPLRRPDVFLMPALVYPVLEEIAFRGLLQELVREHVSTASCGPLSHANLLTSMVFTALHFIYHAPLWAALVFFPSLVFGFFKDRTRSVLAPVILHVFYNSGFL